MRADPAHIREAGPRELGSLARVLARAFFDDPVQRWMLPDDGRRRRASPTLFAGMLRTRLSAGLVTTDPSLSCAALWIPPDAREPPAWQRWREALGFLGALRGRSLRVARALGEVVSARPPGPHWILLCLGTDPERRRRGLASALLRNQLERCDVRGLPAYLECSSPANLPLYRHFGFRVVAEHGLPAGPPVWGMLRPAGGSGLPWPRP